LKGGLTFGHEFNKFQYMLNLSISSVQKVQEELKRLGFSNEVMELQATTRTSAEAAQAVGCQVEQIAKSIVFRAIKTDQPILVIASGPNRVNEKRIEEWISGPLGKADANYVRHKTGFVIGGVPPIGHLKKIEIFIDEDLLQYEEIWAAAGSPHAVFKLTPSDLVKMTEGRIVSIK
jgi:prolyl-tRNA editing enzyme YbaK/EbsC (Cys-tRNA(Pro) deacylase)